MISTAHTAAIMYAAAFFFVAFASMLLVFLKAKGPLRNFEKWDKYSWCGLALMALACGLRQAVVFF